MACIGAEQRMEYQKTDWNVLYHTVDLYGRNVGFTRPPSLFDT